MPRPQTPHDPCSWAVVDGLLHVRSALGTKIADIGGLTPESLARLLLFEMACHLRPSNRIRSAAPELFWLMSSAVYSLRIFLVFSIRAHQRAW